MNCGPLNVVLNIQNKQRQHETREISMAKSKRNGGNVHLKITTLSINYDMELVLRKFDVLFINFVSHHKILFFEVATNFSSISI